MASTATTMTTPTKKSRPPQLSIPTGAGAKFPAAIPHQSPALGPSPSSVSSDDDELPESPRSIGSASSSDTDTSSPLENAARYFDAEQDDDVSREWLSLRKTFKKNLRLRPLGSSNNLAQDARDAAQRRQTPRSGTLPDSAILAGRRRSSPPLSALDTPSSAVSTASMYYTPTSDISHTPVSAHYIGPSLVRSPKIDYAAYHTPRTPSPRPSGPVEPADLPARFEASTQPLLIDTRPLGAYLASRLRGSVNVAIPSLILKRVRTRANASGPGGFQALSVVRQYITTDRGKDRWDALTHPGGEWDGDVLVYDDEMDPRERETVGATAWALVPLLRPLLGRGGADWLAGGLAAARATPELAPYFVAGEADDASPLAERPRSAVALHPPNGVGGAKKPGGLFQLNTVAAARSNKAAMPEVEHTTTSAPATQSQAPALVPRSHPQLHLAALGPLAPRSPLPVMASVMRNTSHLLDDATPSPPPSQAGFARPSPPAATTMRRPSATSLRKLDTRSAERLPKLSVRPVPSKSLNLSLNLAVPNANNGLGPLDTGPAPHSHVHAPPPALSLNLRPPRSPSHLTLVHSNHTSPPPSAVQPPGGWAWNSLPPPTPGWGANGSSRTSSPHTPRSSVPPSPLTARPTPDTAQPPTTETEDAYEFRISTILPGFLFLGPELIKEEHVEELEALGVKRILNIAYECDDDAGLRLRERFDKYVRIPMRDTVEEDNITRGVREACEALDDARLHSAPTYVHCKAGKSRSVTAVMAYLIHANRWTLSRAYSFVLERRKGISPNIGFVSELMTFEEQELGSKSMGVVKPSGGGGGDSSQPSRIDTGGEHHAGPVSAAPVMGGASSSSSNTSTAGVGGSYGVAAGGRRTGHVRESLPVFNRIESDAFLEGVVMFPGEGAGQEMEIRDADGRYRHVRRAPVDEKSLQPLRRASKAGLESSGWL